MTVVLGPTWAYTQCDKLVALQWSKKVKERIVLREIHLRSTGRHLSIGSHSVTCHPTKVTAFTPTGQVGTRFIDPVRMKG